MTATRRRRGADTQAAVAGWFREHGWPFAESTGAGRLGRDVTGMPGLACEVKARRDFAPLEWVRQAQAAAGHDVPFVVHRPDGMGPASVPAWPVTLTLREFTWLLHRAGYGTPAEGDTTPCPPCPPSRSPSGPPTSWKES